MKKQKSEFETHHSLTKTQKLIVKECNYIRDLLLEKNESYGDSAIDNLQIFGRSKPGEAIRCRIDDKLKRIACGKKFKDERTTEDLIGYLILLRVEKKIRQKIKKLRKRKK